MEERRYGEERVSTSQETWIVDRLQQRFLRMPRGADPTDPALPAVWVPYHSAWRDPRTGALTLTLDPGGTHLLHIVP
jgi:hypothetical protein